MIPEALDHNRRIRACALILSRLYNIHLRLDTPFVRIVKDPKTGLERTFRDGADH